MCRDEVDVDRKYRKFHIAESRCESYRRLLEIEFALCEEISDGLNFLNAAICVKFCVQ